MFTLSTFVLSIAAVATMILALLVVSQQSRTSANRHFFVFALSVAGWTISNALFVENIAEQLRFVLALISYGFAAVLALNFFLFCHDLAVRKYPPRLMVGAKILGVLTATVSVIPGVVAYGLDGLAVKTHLPGLLGYAAVLLLFFGLGLWVLIRAMIETRSRSDKHRIRVILTGLSLSSLIGVGCNLILPLFDNYAFVTYGPLGSLVLVAVCAYAIVRHSLFDIKLVAVRGVAYAASLSVLAGIYYISAYLISEAVFQGQATNTFSVSPLNIALALVLAFVFQPIKQFFDTVTNSLFFKGRYSRDEFYTNLNNVLTETTELIALLRQSARVIVSTLSAEDVLFVLAEKKGAHISVGTKGHRKFISADYECLVGEWQASGMLYGESMVMRDRLGTGSTLSRLLRSHGIQLAFPLRQRDAIIGFLCIGDRKSGSYVARDINVIETVANELAIAIENALSLREVRLLNETLQQRIDEATKELRASNSQLRKLDEVKDEFISMASHQLRTPLTSIKGYLDMILEGDAGEITPMQRKFLTEAFVSSERMVHLINDFLNVSRLQTGKFMIEKRPVDLAKIVGQEIDSLKISANGRELSFNYKKPKQLPLLMLDEGKIRQVIMNFADNALYYSRSGTTIGVTLALEGDDVVLKVKDTGIGVPEEEQARLFTKFYRATNARKQRPDGTGVGLYLAKRVVMEHGGSVIFASTEGKGSTFGFRLPIDRLRVRDNANQLDDQPDDN